MIPTDVFYRATAIYAQGYNHNNSLLNKDGRFEISATFSTLGEAFQWLHEGWKVNEFVAEGKVEIVLTPGPTTGQPQTSTNPAGGSGTQNT